MTTPEGKVEKYLVRRVQETGGKIRKLKWISRNGACDRIAWWPSVRPTQVVFIEVKAEKKKPTVIQQRQHESMREDGLNVHTITCNEMVDLIIDLYANQHEAR
jgi:Holliday junction resolvase-like predicted endonuclease